MTTSSSTTTATSGITPRLLRNLTAGILFGLLGFAVNCFRLELFFNIDFLFGSIITMFVLPRYGPWPGTLAAVIAATPTWHHWHHPWAIVIFTMEAFIAGMLLEKRRWELSVNDIVYWFSGGLSLVYLFYHLVMGFSNQSTLLIALKQGVNGVFNSLVAMAISIAVSYSNSSPKKLPGLRELLFVSLSFFVLIPAMGYLYFDINRSLGQQLDTYRQSISRACGVADQSVSLWLALNRDTIVTLAKLVEAPEVMRQPEMQRIVETMRSTNPDFKRMAVIGKTSVTQAFSPLLDEYGSSNIGLNLSDRPYIKPILSPEHPIVYEIFAGRIGIPGPRLIILAPMLKRNNYRGAAFGVLDISVLQHLLRKIVGERAMAITLVDRNGRIVISTQDKRKPLDSFRLPENGSLKPLENGISHWTPNQQPETSAMKRWFSSFYIKQIPIGIGNGWQLVIESSLKPQLEIIGQRTSESLGIIALLIMATIALSHLFAAKFSSVFRELERVTREFPLRISSDESIVWPMPMTREIAGLTGNFQLMSAAIQQHVAQLEILNETLEQRVAERTRELQESEKFTIGVMDSLKSNIAVLDAHGVIVAVNEPWKIFARENGNPAADHIGTNYLSVCKSSISKEDNEAFVGINALLRGDREQFTLEYPCHSPDKQRWFMMNATKSKCTRNGIVISHMDISERKQAQLQLEELNHTLKQRTMEAEQASFSKSRFLANMSHEIRTPMNGVIGMTSILLQTELDQTQRKYAELIKVSGNNLLHLINDILDLSKIEANKIELENRPFDLLTEVSGAIDLLSFHALEKGLKLGFNIEPDVTMPLKGDARRLRQIIINLVGNAIKFTETGSVALTISQKKNGVKTALLLFSIADSGIGIPAGKQEIIFEFFTQADNSTTRKYGGTGLGLTICKQLVGIMGGEIGVDSSEGKGATFWFTVMLEKQSEEEIVAHATRTKSWTPLNKEVTAKKNGRILLAEDDPINQMVAESFLTRLGYSVDIAANGREALRFLSKIDYSLVLMDCHMPEMDGFEATAIIRDSGSNVRNHSLPVIAITANALQEDREKCLSAGMDDYLPKPLDIDSLAEILGTWLVEPPENSLHVFDEAGLLMRHNGNKSLVEEITRLFAAKAPGYIAAIRESLLNGDSSSVRHRAHSLKGAAATLGADRVAALASELAELGKINRLENADQAMQQLTKEFECLLTALTDRGWIAGG